MLTESIDPNLVPSYQRSKSNQGGSDKSSLVVSSNISSFMTRVLTSVIGCYVQWALTVVFMALVTGLLTTLGVDSGLAEWIGCQVFLGAGVGCGLHAAFSAPELP
jgi:hypothetical protein